MNEKMKRVAIIGMVLSALNEEDNKYLKSKISPKASEALAEATVELMITALKGEAPDNQQILDAIVELIEDFAE